jgi:hypothetical protein
MKPEASFCVHKSLSLVPILCLINPVQILTLYLWYILFNIILSYTPSSTNATSSIQVPRHIVGYVFDNAEHPGFTGQISV